MLINGPPMKIRSVEYKININKKAKYSILFLYIKNCLKAIMKIKIFINDISEMPKTKSL
jgi:hypothetical protein